jgi:prevent-host-death family protein
MKTIGVRALQQQIKECVDAAQTERVVITRHGKPAAVVIGAEGYDWEDLVWMTDPTFWKTIAERRAQMPTISHEALEAELFPKRARQRAQGKRKRTGKGGKRA